MCASAAQDNRKITEVKVRFYHVIRHGGNRGRDDRYIRLRSHIISHPVVSRLRRSHSITFSGNICFQFTYESWQNTKTLVNPCLPNPDQSLGQYSNVHLDILKLSFHHSTKFPCKALYTTPGGFSSG